MPQLIGVWIVGWLVSVVVLRARAGAPWFARIRAFEYGLGWTWATAFKAFAWPITLIAWLASGRPEPKVLFNEKAAQARERETAMQRAAHA